MEHDSHSRAAHRLVADAWPLNLAVAWIAFGRAEPPVIAAGADTASMHENHETYQNQRGLMERAARWLAQVIPQVVCVGRRPSIDGIPSAFGPSRWESVGDDIRCFPCSIPGEWLGLRRTDTQRRPGDIMLFEVDEDDPGNPRFVGFHSVFVSRGDVERAFREHFGDTEAGREWRITAPVGDREDSMQAGALDSAAGPQMATEDQPGGDGRLTRANVTILEQRPTEEEGPSRRADDAPERRPVFSPEALSAWFLLRVQRWPKDAPFPNEEADLAAARNHFEGNIPRDPFREIRRKKVPENWRKSGQRKPR
jgi:hypothetical protein